jgi:hypothetical protein
MTFPFDFERNALNIRFILCGLAMWAALYAMAGTTRAQIFVTNFAHGDAGASTIGEYTTSGATVNPALISGLTFPGGIAISGNKLFVASGEFGGMIGEYTLSGTPVNPALITGLDFPGAMTVSGGDLFVATPKAEIEAEMIGKYTTSGATVNAALIPQLGPVADMAVSGDKLFISDVIDGLVGEYTTSGATVNAALISGLNEPVSMAVASGSVPDVSSTWTLLLLGLTTTLGLKLLLRRPA